MLLSPSLVEREQPAVQLKPLLPFAGPRSLPIRQPGKCRFEVMPVEARRGQVNGPKPGFRKLVLQRRRFLAMKPSSQGARSLGDLLPVERLGRESCLHEPAG